MRRVRGGPRVAGRGGGEPVRPAGQLLLPLPLGGRVRAGRARGHPAAGRPDGAGPAGRHDPGGPAGARGHGLVRRRGRGPRARGRRRRRTVADPGRAAVAGRSCGRDEDAARRSRSGTTSTSARSSGRTTWPPPGPLPPTWRTWVRCQPDGRPSTTRGSTRRARSSCSTSGAGRPARARTRYLEPPFIAPSLDLYASFQYPRQLVGVAAPRRALAGGAGRPAVVDRAGLVA